MMEPVRLTLPLPSKVLSPNARVHWSVLARAKRAARRTAYYLTLQAVRRPPKWTLAKVRMTFYWPTRHKRDADNAIASMKAALDGIADAGIVENDAGFVHWPAVMEYDKRNPRVEVVVEPLEVEEAAA